MNLQNIARVAGNTIREHSPEILTALGAVGVVSTAYLFGRAGYLSYKTIDEAFEEGAYDEVPNTRGAMLRRHVAITWRLYILPTSVAAVTIAATVASHSVLTRRNAAAVAALGFTEMAFREYREKNIENQGKAKDRKIVEDISQDHVTKNPPSDTIIALAGDQKTVVLERMAGRYFVSDMETIRRAQNDINEMILHSDYALLNDFYERVGLERTQIGDEMGWNHENMLEIEFSSSIHDQEHKGTPIMVIGYRNNPVPNPFRIWG